jgi:pilus assembly protein FimV
MLQRLSRIAILAIWASAAGGSAWSFGIGRVPDAVVLGQPLDLAVPLHLAPAEALLPGCVNAEVTIGARRLPSEAVRVQLERAADGSANARVRIHSGVTVQEPVVAVHLTIGCPTSVDRQFTAFADPPAKLPSALPAVAGVPTAPATPGARAAARQAATAGQPVAQRTRGPSGDAGPAPRAGTETPPRATAPASIAMAAAPARWSAPASSLDPAAPGREPHEAQRLLQAARRVLAEQDGQLVRMAYATSAAQAAAAAADRRVAVLEQDLLQMRDGAQQQRATTAQLRQALSRAAEQNHLLWALAALVLAMGGCTAWLVARLRVLQREHRAWRRDADAARSSIPPMPSVPPLFDVGAAAVARQAHAAAARGAAGKAVDALRSAEPGRRVRAIMPSPQGWADDASTPPGSIDELIDVDQQAEFFVLLGEEQAAIDLLKAHLGHSGEASPLLFLRLLEVCQSRGDRETYDRTRRRFDEQFGASTPQWGAERAYGRRLQDYPAALATLQAAWPEPRDAIGELEKLLFHRLGSELMDLPAYRDALTLYAVARDLNRRGAAQTDGVDLLLPLAQGRDAGTNARHSIFDRVGVHLEAGPATALDRDAAPAVDLDLDEPAPKDSHPPVAVAHGRAV